MLFRECVLHIYDGSFLSVTHFDGFPLLVLNRHSIIESSPATASLLSAGDEAIES